MSARCPDPRWPRLCRWRRCHKLGFVTREFTQPPDQVPFAQVLVTEPGAGAVEMLGAGSAMLVFAWVVLFPNRSHPPELVQPFVPSG